MARKPKKPAEADPNTINAVQQKGEGEADALARTMLDPSIQAALTLREANKGNTDLHLSGLITALKAQTDAVSANDLDQGAAMLTAQAHTLDALFNTLASRAINSDYLNKIDRYLKIAMRAQAQCRATWDTVARLKNPPIAGYVGQANIAHGPQQVNKGAPPPTVDQPTTEKQSEQNKLLEQSDGERLDTGETSAAGRNDPAMATVGQVHRAENA